ncbi:hypothetical protein [Allochromatium vinosum]|uniref:hypothetical protein n=1 Tax=Allochromatium vinosum TaxID=1049 RepID=UPI0011D07C61|nr:hypothetical protein [Allochromatium vinosum]
MTAYVLVMGGWYPTCFTPSGVVLLDRCVLSKLYLLKQKGIQIKSERDHHNKYWLNFLNRSDLILNPVLCEIESQYRRHPIFSEFRFSFDNACELIKSVLPESKIISYDDINYFAAFEAISERSNRFSKESQFLVDVSQLLKNRTSKKKIIEIENKIVEVYKSCGLNGFSIALILALSCLYEKEDGSQPLIGRKIIKPKENYSELDAYNSLSDIFALEILALSNGLGSSTLSYCTRDKNLAALWCSLKLTPGVWSNGVSKLEFLIDDKLFPRLSNERIAELKERIENSI